MELNNINNSQRYPLGNTYLDGETDYVKNSYFTMLATFLQQGGNDSIAQKTLFTRLVSGVDTGRVAEDYLISSQKFSAEIFEEFVGQYKDKDLRYRFVLDALILLGCDKQEEDTISLLVTFVEAFRISKEDMQRLFKLAKSILMCDSDLYWDYDNDKVYSLTYENLQTYISSYLKDYIKIDDKNFILCFTKQRKVNLREYTVKEEKSKSFLGAHYLYSRDRDRDENGRYGFHRFEKIVVKNCVFGKDQSEYFKFYQCNHIVFEHCLFSNLQEGICLDAEDYCAGYVDREERNGENLTSNFYECSFTDYHFEPNRESGCLISFVHGSYHATNISKRKNFFLRCNFKNIVCDWSNKNSHKLGSDMSAVSYGVVFCGYDVEFEQCRFESCFRNAPEDPWVVPFGWSEAFYSNHDGVIATAYNTIVVRNCEFDNCTDLVDGVVWGPKARLWNNKKSLPSRLFDKGTVDNGTNKMKNCAQFS